MQSTLKSECYRVTTKTVDHDVSALAEVGMERQACDKWEIESTKRYVNVDHRKHDSNLRSYLQDYRGDGNSFVDDTRPVRLAAVPFEMTLAHGGDV
jgi:hypothetical protein